MSAFVFSVLLLAGGVAGLITSLAGVGGSMVIIPLLLLLLPAAGVPAAVLPATALATTMAASLCTALMATWSHWRAGNLLKPLEPSKLVLMASAGIGAAAGVSLAAAMPQRLLMAGMCVSQAVFCVLLWRAPKRKPAPADASVHFRPNVFSSAYFVMVGFLASIGAGGALVVPYLTLRGVPQRQAIANAAWLGLSVGGVGLALFMLHTPVEAVGAGSAGFVFLPAAAALIAGSAAAVRLGAHLAKRLDASVLRRLVAAGLALSSLRLLFKLL